MGNCVDPISANVSVVTPAFNAASHIEECIRSVLAQTHENWTHTVIDNASTDATPDIVERLASRDSRIRLMRFEEFVDATENHNRAFRAVDDESAYCKMVQADDWVYPSCFSAMVAAAEAAENIGIVSAYRLAGTVVDLTGIPYWRTVVPGHEILRMSLLGGPYVTGAPTALLLRSELVREHEAFYDSTFWHSDTEATYRVLTTHDLAFVHQVLTFARRDSPSRASWAVRMNTNGPEAVRFMLRYGGLVLDKEAYRHRLRLELRRYVSFHARQLAKRSRWRDREFFSFHDHEIDQILRQGGDDTEVKAAMVLVKALLTRKRLAGGFMPQPMTVDP